MYNLKEDWSEKNDVAADHPEVVKRLSAQLDQWLKELPEQPSANTVSKGREKVKKDKAKSGKKGKAKPKD